MYLSQLWDQTLMFLCMRSYHCIVVCWIYKEALEALKPYTAAESYLLCVSGVSCHGEKILFEVWPPSFTLTIMLLALSCPPCKAHVFSFVRLPLPYSCTPPGFPLLCHPLSHSLWRTGPNLIPRGMLGSVVTVQGTWTVQKPDTMYISVQNIKQPSIC